MEDVKLNIIDRVIILQALRQHINSCLTLGKQCKDDYFINSAKDANNTYHKIAGHDADIWANYTKNYGEFTVIITGKGNNE